MILKFFASYNGSVESYTSVPTALRKYALRHAWARYFAFDEGEYLVQQIEGKHFAIWVHHLQIQKPIRLGAYFEDLCMTINYTQEGKLDAELKGFGPVTLEEGTYHFFCVPPKVMHPCHFTRGKYCFIHLDMQEELLCHIDFNPLCREALQKYFQDPANNGAQLPACAMQPIVRDCIQSISRCQLEDRRAYDAFIAHQVSRLLFEFNRQLPALQPPQRIDYAAQRIEELKLYIQANLHQKLTVDSLAAHCHTSGINLRSSFRHREKESLFTYILRCRMETARQLILETERSITGIAEAVGYEDDTAFWRSSA